MIETILRYFCLLGFVAFHPVKTAIMIEWYMNLEENVIDQKGNI